MPEHPEKQIWFPAKRYGWGWGLPCRWQGWVVVIVWVLLSASIGWLGLPAHPWLFNGVLCFLTLLLFSVCWWKGEKPRWRWGKD
jgi:hypothetical protein